MSDWTAVRLEVRVLCNSIVCCELGSWPDYSSPDALQSPFGWIAICIRIVPRQHCVYYKGWNPVREPGPSGIMGHEVPEIQPLQWLGQTNEFSTRLEMKHFYRRMSKCFISTLFDWNETFHPKMFRRNILTFLNQNFSVLFVPWKIPILQLHILTCDKN